MKLGSRRLRRQPPWRQTRQGRGRAAAAAASQPAGSSAAPTRAPLAAPRRQQPRGRRSCGSRVSCWLICIGSPPACTSSGAVAALLPLALCRLGAGLATSTSSSSSKPSPSLCRGTMHGGSSPSCGSGSGGSKLTASACASHMRFVQQCCVLPCCGGLTVSRRMLLGQEVHTAAPAGGTLKYPSTSQNDFRSSFILRPLHAVLGTGCDGPPASRRQQAQAQTRQGCGRQVGLR